MVAYYFKWLILAVIELAVICFIFLHTSIGEMLDQKVKREVSFLGRKFLFIRPYFARFMRRRTEFLYWFVQGLFVFQIVSGFFLPMEDWTKNSRIFLNIYTLVGIFLVFGCMVVSCIWIGIYFLRDRSKRKKEQVIRDTFDDIEEQVFSYPENEMVEEIKVCKPRHKHVESLLLILPHNHKLDYNGFVKGTKKALEQLVNKESPLICKRVILFGDQDSNPEKVGKNHFYIGETNFGFYLHNMGNYQKLSAFLNQHNIATIRLQYKEGCDEHSFDRIKIELKEIEKQIRENMSLDQTEFYILGQGLYGSVEAVLLGQEMETDGMVCIGELGSSILEMSENFVKTGIRKCWIPRNTAKKMLQALDHVKALRPGRCCEGKIERTCEGYCKEKASGYFASLARFTSEDLIQATESYQKPILQIQLGDNVYSNGKSYPLQNAHITRCKVEGIYHTMRAGKRKDYISHEHVTRLDLREANKEKTKKFILDHGAELDERILDILGKWMEERQN